jgi:hypothetical protein
MYSFDMNVCEYVELFKRIVKYMCTYNSLLGKRSFLFNRYIFTCFLIVCFAREDNLKNRCCGFPVIEYPLPCGTKKSEKTHFQCKNKN